MEKYYFSSGLYIGVKDLFSNGFTFVSLEMKETIGGSFASGNLEVLTVGTNETLNTFLEIETLDIELGTKQNGSVLKIHGEILSRNYDEVTNIIKYFFNVVPDSNFFKDISTLPYDDIETAINSLWGRNSMVTDNRLKSDLPEGIKFYQNGDLNCKFLGTLLRSYKENSIFALSLDSSIIIKDLSGGIDSMGYEEPGQLFIADRQGSLATVLNNGKTRLIYDQNLYKEPEDPVMKKKDDGTLKYFSKYFDVQTFNTDYKIIGKDYTILEHNKTINNKYYHSRLYQILYAEITDKFVLPYRIGDVVHFKDTMSELKSTPFRTFLISEINYSIKNLDEKKEYDNDLPLKIRYTLRGLSDGKNTSPSSAMDPKDNQAQK